MSTNILQMTKEYALLGVREGLKIPGVGDHPLAKGLNGVGGINLEYMDGSTPLVMNPVVAYVIAAPGMYVKVPYMQRFITELIQTRAKSITGIDLTYNLATDDSQVGHDGQSMTVYTNTTRGSVSPNITAQELPGMPIWNGCRSWMFHINHPDTKFAFVGIPDNEDLLFTSANVSAAVCFVQYDATGRPDNILDGFVISNMAPTDIGPMGSERNLGEVRILDRNISMGGYMNHSDGTRNLAYEIALAMQYHKVDPFRSNLRPYGFKDINSALQNTSVQKDIADFLEDNTPG